jgi:hypothetical protein
LLTCPRAGGLEKSLRDASMAHIWADVQPLYISNPLPFKTGYVPANGKFGKAHNFSGRGLSDKNRNWLEQLSGEEIGDLPRVFIRSVRPQLAAQLLPDSRIVFSYRPNMNLEGL